MIREVSVTGRNFFSVDIMISNTVKRSVLAGLLVVGASAAAPLMAQGHAGGGHFGGGHRGAGAVHAVGWRGGPGYGWHGGYGWYGGGPVWWGAGVGLGLGLGWAYVDSPYAYYPYAPAYVPYAVAPAPVTAAPTQSSAAAGTWYFCEPAKAYYPYVRECAQPWQAVPAVPPQPAQ
jgi:hypothetical protein